MEDPPNFLVLLREIFPRTNEQAIADVIQMIEENSPYDSFEEKIENMINLLSGEGAQGPLPDLSPAQPNSNTEELYRNLTLIYENVDEDYLHDFISSKPANYDIEDAIEELNECDLPEKQIDPIVIKDRLQQALPNADPSFLQKEAQRLARLPSQEIDVFVQDVIEKDDYPTMHDYLKNKKHTSEMGLYTENFNIKIFLEIIPNPDEKFTNPKRQLSLGENSHENDEKYALNFLYNQYRFIRRKYIELLFKWEHKNLIAICDRLEKLKKSLKKPRPIESAPVDSENIPLLQVIAYLKHRKLIKKEVKLKNEIYRQAKQEAQKFNLLETCQCCYDDELIPEECYFCMKDCVFCKDCVKKGVEYGVGKGDIKFPSMSNCNSEFSLHTLQMVLPNNMFQRLTQRIASEEIKKANVDGLETCPFCDFAMILPENEKVFKCINEECLVESCRQCRHRSHIPLRCNEIEYDEDVKRRTFIENKMTEALTRICYNCKKPFIKSSGCNKMTCNCGAKMCYLCGQAVSDYNHFNPRTCPLTSNDAEVNLQRVLRGAEQAKNELGGVEIKFDPTANIQEFFHDE